MKNVISLKMVPKKEVHMEICSLVNGEMQVIAQWDITTDHANNPSEVAQLVKSDSLSFIPEST